jgi:hypothetical protein
VGPAVPLSITRRFLGLLESAALHQEFLIAAQHTHHPTPEARPEESAAIVLVRRHRSTRMSGSAHRLPLRAISGNTPGAIAGQSDNNSVILKSACRLEEGH